MLYLYISITSSIASLNSLHCSAARKVAKLIIMLI